MTPLRFGPPGRQLFGLHVPAQGPRLGHGVVLCNPFGQEAIRCHRLYRVLGERLARAGHDVLRFDYFGTGDSDGDDGAGDLEAWIANTVAADQALAERSGCARRSWFGLRLGATLAALASQRAPVPPRRLVLLDPVTDGAAYLEELRGTHRAVVRAFGARMHATPAALREVDSGSPAFLGFALGTALHAQLRELSPAALAGMRAAGIVLLRSAGALGAGLAAAGGTPVESVTLESRIVWASEEAMDNAVVPADALKAASDALEAGA